MEKHGVAALLVTLVLAGCASSTQPSVMVYPAKGQSAEQQTRDSGECQTWAKQQTGFDPATEAGKGAAVRSEEHTSELQSRLHLVCRLLLEKKKKKRRQC